MFSKIGIVSILFIFDYSNSNNITLVLLLVLCNVLLDEAIIEAVIE